MEGGWSFFILRIVFSPAYDLCFSLRSGLTGGALKPSRKSEAKRKAPSYHLSCSHFNSVQSYLVLLTSP